MTTKLELEQLLSARNAELVQLRQLYAEAQGNIEAQRSMHARIVTELNNTIENWREQLNAADTLRDAVLKADLKFRVVASKQPLYDDEGNPESPAYISEDMTLEAAMKDMRDSGYFFAELEVAQPADKPTKKVFEFDPLVAGDFARAAALAKQHNGIVRRHA